MSSSFSVKPVVMAVFLEPTLLKDFLSLALSYLVYGFQDRCIIIGIVLVDVEIKVGDRRLGSDDVILMESVSDLVSFFLFFSSPLCMRLTRISCSSSFVVFTLSFFSAEVWIFLETRSLICSIILVSTIKNLVLGSVGSFF